MFLGSNFNLIFKIKFKLTLPFEVTLISNFLIDEHLDHISLMYINSNDSNDLDTKILGQWMPYSLNEIIDSSLEDNEVIFHSIFTTTIHIIELTNSLLCPYDLSSKKGNLGAIVFEPEVSLFVVFTKFPTVGSLL